MENFCPPAAVFCVISVNVVTAPGSTPSLAPSRSRSLYYLSLSPSIYIDDCVSVCVDGTRPGGIGIASFWSLRLFSLLHSPAPSFHIPLQLANKTWHILSVNEAAGCAKLLQSLSFRCLLAWPQRISHIAKPGQLTRTKGNLSGNSKIFSKVNSLVEKLH